MKRSFKKPRVKRVRPPKPIEAPKPERPRRSELKSIYRDLITSDQEQRLNTLRRALGWYDRCSTYVGYNIEFEWVKHQLANKNAAERVRTQAINSVQSDAKEDLFLESIKHYQKLVNGYHPPLILPYIRKFKHEKVKLELRRRKLKKRYGEFLNTVQVMLKPRNSNDELITLKVDKLSVEHRIDGSGNVTWDQKFISYVSKLSRKQGMLTAVVELFPALIEAAGMMEEKDDTGHRTGRVVISNAKCKQAVVPMLKHLNQYFLSVDSKRKLIRKPRKKEKKESVQ